MAIADTLQLMIGRVTSVDGACHQMTQRMVVTDSKVQALADSINADISQRMTRMETDMKGRIDVAQTAASQQLATATNSVSSTMLPVQHNIRLLSDRTDGLSRRMDEIMNNISQLLALSKKPPQNQQQ
jgi:hypothetical protein